MLTKIADFVIEHSPTYTQGYNDGLNGRDCFDPSNPSYDKGWLKGAAERKENFLAKLRKEKAILLEHYPD